MKIREIIKAFSDIGSAEGEREAYLTVEYLFGAGYASVKAEPEREYDGEKVKEVLSKRKNKIPLQYIFGEWYFMGERFLVSENCLIPRQDTEILVENAINVIKKGGRIADLCTGSGCIGISVLLNRPDITDLTLVDISNAYNAENHINELRNTLRESEIEEMENGEKNYQESVYYLDIVNELERMGDFIINISQDLKKSFVNK